MSFLRKIAELYATSWVLLLTHAVCIFGGALIGQLAFYGTMMALLKSRGLVL